MKSALFIKEIKMSSDMKCWVEVDDLCTVKARYFKSNKNQTVHLTAVDLSDYVFTNELVKSR